MGNKTVRVATFILSMLFAMACSSPREKKAVALFETHCASCHILPSIEDLPKNIWKEGILPNMAARMGIRDSTNDPLEGLRFREQHAILQSGVYPNKPIISSDDWKLLENYIITMAPDSLSSKTQSLNIDELTQFVPKPINLDNVKGTFITFLDFDGQKNSIITGDLKGELSKYHVVDKKFESHLNTGQAISNYIEKDNLAYITHFGSLNPSEIESGNLQIVDKDSVRQLPFALHRPVHTLIKDLNKDGQEELVVSEFGDLTGALTLFSKREGQAYQKETILNLPGSIRTIAKDMNNDGKEDLVTLISQGNESITILYQQENLKFAADPVIRFSPVYGTSWFELFDYDGDGDDDIVTVNGDNADKSYVHKPYHGLRIHINNGENRFEEKFFYPVNGATRLVARDFDQDGDMDFGVLSTFPDYSRKPELSFIYLENKNPENFNFKPYTFQDSKLARWFLMDAADVDNDGDDDIILSAFSYGFTPVPKNVSELWKSSDVDVMILENRLSQSIK
ncbi:MAG: FG-GAP-like repeat-containing protein [Pricia sp.]